MRAPRILGIALAALVGAIAITLILIWLFVNPNDYKGRIAQAVKNSTGRELQLPGDLKLSVFPWIALELGPATLGNPPGFDNEPFAAVRHVAVRVKLLPLLRKRLEVGRVEIDGLDLRLRTNAQGKGNWQDFGGESTAAAPARRSGSGAETLQSVGGVEIKDSRISDGDLVADQVHLTIGHVAAGAAVPVSLNVNLTTSPGARPIQIAARGNFVYGDNALRGTGLVVHLDDSTLKGDAAITNLDTKAMTFNFALDRIDLDRYLAASKSSPQQSSPQKAPAPAGKSGESSGDSLKTLQLDGKLSIGSAAIVGVTVTDVRATVVAKDGVAHLAPVAAKLYGGTYAGDITIDDRGAKPVIKLNQSLNGLELAPFLKDFAKQQRVSGRVNVSTDLAAQGLAAGEFTKSLNGRVSANVTNGALEGIDLWFEIHRAIALLQKQALPAGTSAGRTKFDLLKLSAVVTNGITSTNDLSIASQNLHVSGEGSANLVTEAINYRIKAQLLKDSPNPGSGGTLAEVPLLVTGTLKSPEVQPDVQAMARARVQQELGKHKGEVQKKLQDALKGLLK